MTFRQFMEEHDFSENDVYGYTSEKHFYNGTKIPVFVVVLNKAIEGQEALCLSRTAAEAYRNGEVTIGELTVKYCEEAGRYGLIMPLNTLEIRW